MVARLGVGVVWGKCKKGGSGQGGCSPRIKLIVKMQKKSREGGVVGGVWVDFNQNSILVYLFGIKSLMSGLEPTTSGLENLPSYPLG